MTDTLGRLCGKTSLVFVLTSGNELERAGEKEVIHCVLFAFCSSFFRADTVTDDYYWDEDGVIFAAFRWIWILSNGCLPSMLNSQSSVVARSNVFKCAPIALFLNVLVIVVFTFTVDLQLGELDLP